MTMKSNNSQELIKQEQWSQFPRIVDNNIMASVVEMIMI